MKKALRNILPRSVLNRVLTVRAALWLLIEYLRDARRYEKYSLPGEVESDSLYGRQHETQVVKDYHRIEKGLSLRQVKRPFGAAVEGRLEMHLNGHGADDAAPYIRHGHAALAALRKWNLTGELDNLIAPSAREDGALPSILDDPEDFFLSRSSCRDFESRDLSDAVIERAVQLAISTPSVCNRQSWRVRFFRNKDAQEILRFQNGNAGFGSSIPVTALITVDTRLFSGMGERNQPWIEGGLFSMSLVWAFQSLGVSTCMLNMSVGNSAAARLRNTASLPDYEVPIMMIAVGYGRQGHRVARSPRRDASEINMTSAFRG